MKDSLIVTMNVWQLARFYECLEVYHDADLRGRPLRDAIAEWIEVNEYTQFVVDDIEEVLLRMCRVPHMREKCGNLLEVLRNIDII